jgi:hypothetical protein
MIRTGARPVSYPCRIVLGILLGMAPSFSVADPDGRIWLVGEPSEGMPPCEEFFDKWEVEGAPSPMMAMFGLGREVFAANDCVTKGDVAAACKHWQGLLAVMDKMGPPLSESRGDIEGLMQQHDCEAIPASDAAPEAAQDSESASGKAAPEAGPNPAPDSDSGAGPGPAE